MVNNYVDGAGTTALVAATRTHAAALAGTEGIAIRATHDFFGHIGAGWTFTTRTTAGVEQNAFVLSNAANGTLLGNLTVSGTNTSSVAGSLAIGTATLAGSERVNITRAGTGNTLILANGTVTGVFYQDTAAMWYGTSSAHPLYFYTGGGAQSMVLSTTGNLSVTGSVTTGAPTGGAGAWKLGIANAVSPTSPNRTITIEIGGTVYYLHAKTTNN
jgi:hypothetical protein